MKQVPIPAQIATLEARVQADVAHWQDLLANGCNDPFWPDGVNMNLVRNHIIYGLRQIAELRASDGQLSMFDVPAPEVGDVMQDKRIPPMVDDGYMARDRYEHGRHIKATSD